MWQLSHLMPIEFKGRVTVAKSSELKAQFKILQKFMNGLG
jgi:hypothetical protein